jgi:hypothetical protein
LLIKGLVGPASPHHREQGRGGIMVMDVNPVGMCGWLRPQRRRY